MLRKLFFFTKSLNKNPSLRIINLQSKYHHNQAKILEIKNNKSSLELVISHENIKKNLSFDPHWLRFNCQSEKSRQISTGQRIISVDDIPEKLTIDSIQQSDDQIIVKWNPESKQSDSVFLIEYLIGNYPSEIESSSYTPCEELKFLDYRDFFDIKGNRNESKLFEWLEQMTVYGLVIVKNLPTENNMVKKLAELIAPVQNTIYDQVFDVKVDKNPINIAYSNAPLEFHMDLMYYESAPGMQFLHCLKFDPNIVGGESLFADSFEIAYKFKEEYPDFFYTLTKIPATFQKIHLDRARPVYMVYQRPHIVLNHKHRIIAVNWAPAFEGPLTNLTKEEIKAYYKAYLAFSKAINSYPKSIKYKLKEGEVACFNNRRILHARNGFILNNGTRHFQGCYLNIDEFKSEALVKQFQMKYHNAGKNVKNVKLELRKSCVGNHDYY